MRSVVAIGGNVILKPDPRMHYENYVETVTEICKRLSELIDKSQVVALTHGNGPQVGNILIQQERSQTEVLTLPLDVCVAETQAQIGYLFQQNLTAEVSCKGLERKVVVLLTRVLVEKNDPAFGDPTKPIGPYYSQKPRELELKHVTFQKIGQKYRRVVPSPKPVKIVECDIIKKLIEEDHLVIACGGGGIPVIRDNTKYKGVEAVIDKDFSTQLLATLVDANLLVIVMEEDGVYLNYGTKDQEKLDKLTLKDAKLYLKEKYFQSGSMAPKIEATIRFLERGGDKAVIASWKDMAKVVTEEVGTVIVK